MLPCYQKHTNCNEKKNAPKSEMQSNTKHEFECFRKQGAKRRTNQDYFDKMIKNEGDEYGIIQKKMSI
jgi:hypothetical protein